jgi:hypothetical protein
MYRFRIIIVPIVIAFILAFMLSCSEDNITNGNNEEKDKSDEAKIQDLFRTLATAYNADDAITAMNYFSEDFLDSGITDYTQTRFMWGFRSQYEHSMELSDIKVEITDSIMATCSFHMHKEIHYPSQLVVIDGYFPQTLDLNVHILRKEEEGWKIYGNQQ